MKTRLSRILPALMLLLLAGCQNLDDIYSQLKSHEDRLTKLESLTSGVNDQIAALQALVDAQAAKVNIVSYEPLSDGTGYLLRMSDGQTITLKNGANGKDGSTPAIGVKAGEDGILYWTIDGEFILDVDGNRVPAAGKDGANAVTPQLRVNADGFWEISYDEGKRWEQITDPEGNPVKAEGSDAAVDLTITEEGDNIVITYNGATFIIPKASEEPEEPVVGTESFVVTFGDYDTADPYTHTLTLTVEPSDQEMTYVADGIEAALVEPYMTSQKAFIDFWKNTPTFQTTSGTQTKDILINASMDFTTFEMVFGKYYIFVYGWQDDAATTDLYLYEFDGATGEHTQVELPKE